MSSNTKKLGDPLAYHELNNQPGKLAIVATKPMETQADLSLAYSPGVADVCTHIENETQDVYKYTAKANLVGVVTNGTAVLGLGNIGALASKPVMEGKAVLFKKFANVDCFDIEVEENDPTEFIKTVKRLEPTLGGINLEDIKAPECFEIERRLQEELSIPVMHDDQHGTAIISSAALINALELNSKKIEEIRIVVNGAGAAAIASAELYLKLGVKLENIVLLDSKGVIRADRQETNKQKLQFATKRDIHTLEDAMRDADMFLGLSKADILSPEMIMSMAKDPIVFALANPNPEIAYETAIATRKDIIFATGRSDHPNQVNNVLGFPYIFRGALDVRAKKINEEMKIAAVYALAKLAKEETPQEVLKAYGDNSIQFGRQHIIPKPLDPRLISEIAIAVAKAAIDSGVARKEIKDWDAYRKELITRRGDVICVRCV